MKSLLIACLLIFSANAFGASDSDTKRDSIVINFGDKTRIVVYTERKEDFKKLLNYDVNAMLRDMGAKMDTVTKQGETRIYFDEPNGRKYLKDTTLRTQKEDYVRIGIRGIHIKDGNEEVHISTKGIQVKDGNEIVNIGKTDEDDDKSINSSSSSDERKSSKNRWKLSNSDFKVSLGLNTYLRPDGQSLSNEYDLRPFGSRYFSLAFRKKLTISQGQSAAFRLLSGFEFSWYNFMFDGNNVATKGTTQVQFPESAQSLEKSKLTVAYLNIPFMPYVAFRRGAITHIGAGAYVGYRLDSYTKTKLAETGKKERNHSNFYLNDFRYGLMAEIGFKGAPDFFVQYDLNELYQSGKGPQLNPISFGIRF